jgi:hypothetical protein
MTSTEPYGNVWAKGKTGMANESELSLEAALGRAQEMWPTPGYLSDIPASGTLVCRDEAETSSCLNWP